MSYDIAISMDQDGLNRIVDSLYSRPGIRSRLFKGSDTENIEGLSASASWDVLRSPRVSLTAPSGQQWRDAIGPGGTAPRRADGVFVVVFDSIKISYSLAGENGGGTISAQALCKAGIRDGDELFFDALGVVVPGLATASRADQSIYKHLAIPMVLNTVNSMLSGAQIPELDFQGLRFGKAALAVGAGRLAAFANLSGGAPSPPAMNSMPGGSFYVLLSRNAVQRIATTGSQGLRGESVSERGRESFGLGKATYHARARLESISASPASDLTQVNAQVEVSASASAGIDVFGAIFKEVGKTVEETGKKIGNTTKDVVNTVGDAFSSY